MCRVCMTAKTLGEFYFRNDTKTHKRTCKTCIVDRQIERKYDITIAEYRTMEKMQRGKCRICGHKPRKDQMRLAVDHCHTTQAVRGLLCSNCNTALGHMKDDTSRLAKAIRYLQGEDIV